MQSNITTLDQFKDKHYGRPGTKERDELDAGYENFKVGELIHEARLEKLLTQAELAAKAGMTCHMVGDRVMHGRTIRKAENGDIWREGTWV